MMNRKVRAGLKKKTVSVLLTVAFFAIHCVSALAKSGDAFTHIDEPDGTVSVIHARESYIASRSITASTLGLDEPLRGLSDIFCAPDGRIYLLCGEDSYVVVLNADFSLHAKLELTDGDGGKLHFGDAKGLYVDGDGTLYICDTKNARILVADNAGRYLSEMTLPASDLIPEDFSYQPSRIIKDADGYTYILSVGCYYGALLYSPEDEFIGFYGANTVNATVLDTLSLIWDLLTATDAKKAGSARRLPYSFVDMSLDPDGFLVTCTGTTTPGSNGTGQIKKISPYGGNILYRKTLRNGPGTSDSMNFLETKVITKNNQARTQNIVSVDVSPQGYIYALDKTYGLIYVYDKECNPVTAFGGGQGSGTRLGLFEVPEALALCGDNLLVIDSKKMSVTVFTMTEFGKLLQEAQTRYLGGDYAEAGPYWQQVLELDRGNQLAYRGLAMESYVKGDYKAAADYARRGLDYTVYDLAYQTLLVNFVNRHFVWIAAALVLLAGGLTAFFILLKKRKTAVIRHPVRATFASCMFYPFRSFEEVKYKKQGSTMIAVTLVVLFYLVSVIQSTASGFLFMQSSPRNYNTLITLAQTAGVVVLWTVTNWLVCTLFSGKGSLSEVFIASSYALLPVILYTFVRFVLSHILPLSGMALLDGVYVAVLLYTFFLLAVAMMTVHEYGFFRFLLTGLVTVFGMIMVVFLLFMIVILIQQFWNFIYALFMEAVYR